MLADLLPSLIDDLISELKPDGTPVESSKALTILHKKQVTFFEELNLSILSAEYLDSPGLFLYLKEFYSSSNRLLNTAMDFEEDIAEDIIKLNTIILYSLRRYETFIHVVSKSDGQNAKILFEIFQILHSEDHLNAETFSLKYILESNLKVSRDDHFLSYDIKRYQDLLKISLTLEKDVYKNYPYSEIIREKCNFLIKKIGKRINEKPEDFHFVIDGKIETLSGSEEVSRDFKKFNDKCKVHYDKEKLNLSDRKAAYSNYIKKWNYYKSNHEIEEGSEVKLNDFHGAIRYLKDDIGSMERLSNLVSEFDTFYTEKISSGDLDKYDLRSFYLAHGYTLNNLLSLAIDSRSDFETIENIYNQILEFQNFSEIDNYFPHRRFCQYLISSLEVTFEQNKEMNQQEIDQFLLCFNRYKDALRICRERSFHPFRLTKNESYLNYTMEVEGGFRNVKVFMASTFSLPINYEIEESEFFQELQSKSINLNSASQFQRFTNKAYDGIKSVAEKVEQSESKYIELLGIFSAVVLFSFGNIQFFTTKDGSDPLTLKESISFSLLFSTSLCLFFFLLWIFRSRSTYNNQFKWAFFILLCLVFIISGLISIGII